jgi:hypothetical protein
MTVQVKFVSAFIRRIDVDTHYPGGCAAFEAQHTCAQGDPDLMVLLAMSGQDLEYAVSRIAQSGLDIDRFVAVADMWAGPIKEAKGIRFFSQPGCADVPVPAWYAAQEHGYV